MYFKDHSGAFRIFIAYKDKEVLNFSPCLKGGNAHLFYFFSLREGGGNRLLLLIAAQLKA